MFWPSTFSSEGNLAAERGTSSNSSKGFLPIAVKITGSSDREGQPTKADSGGNLLVAEEKAIKFGVSERRPDLGSGSKKQKSEVTGIPSREKMGKREEGVERGKRGDGVAGRKKKQQSGKSRIRTQEVP